MIESLPVQLPPRLVSLRDYWQQLRAAKVGVPTVADIDLMAIYRDAPYVFIADRRVENGVSLYFWRYWGTAIRDLTGVEATGKFLHETHQHAGAEEARIDYDTVLADLKPSYWRRKVRTLGEDRSYLVYERIVFPLVDAQGVGAHILGVFSAEGLDRHAMRTGEHLSHDKIDIYERGDED